MSKDNNNKNGVKYVCTFRVCDAIVGKNSTVNSLEILQSGSWVCGVECSGIYRKINYVLYVVFFLHLPAHLLPYHAV